MANPSSRQGLIDYCLRRLGDPVIEINVDEDQIEDRVDEALQYYREYHSEGTYRGYIQHLVTEDDITNKYIPISNNVQQVTKLFKMDAGVYSRNMFSVKYQMHLNDIANMHSYIGDLAYYEQVMQYVSLLDMRLNGSPQVDYVRKQTDFIFMVTSKMRMLRLVSTSLQKCIVLLMRVIIPRYGMICG